MDIYGLAGGNKTGKSTLAEFLHETAVLSEHIEYSDLIREVANRWLETLPQIPDEADEFELISIANSWIYDLPDALGAVLQIETEAHHFVIDEDDTERYRNMHSRLIEYLNSLANVAPGIYIERENKIEHLAILQWLGYSTREFISPTIWPVEMRRRVAALQQDDTEVLTIGGIRYEQDAGLIRDLGGIAAKVYRIEVEKSHTYHTETAANQWVADVDIINNGNLEQLRKAATVLRAVDLGEISVKPAVINTKEL